MNLNERGSGTIPIDPIELPLWAPLPDGCGCSWGYDMTRGRKYVKYLYRECAVMVHRIAFVDSQISTPEITIVTKKKRGKGRPKNESGQWHKKSSDSASA